MAIAEKELVEEALREVYDPEVGINIIDLGLVYGIEIDDNGLVDITMTLTTPACPLGPSIEQEIKDTLVGNLPGITETHINWVWTPPWGLDKMSEDAKMELGYW